MHLLARNRGFTLIELLVVIAIIGVLASVVLASLNSAREKARDTQRISALRQVQAAIEIYYTDNNTYPNTSGSWRGSSPGCYGGHGDNAIPGLVSGGYIPTVPQDPQASGSSCYLYRSNGTDYMFLAHQTIESFDPDEEPHPMDRVNYNQQSIAVYSPGARNW